jgi:hypothetical protein
MEEERKLRISDIYKPEESPMPATKKVFWKSSLIDTDNIRGSNDDAEDGSDFMNTLRSEQSLKSLRSKPPASSYLKSKASEDKYDMPKLRGDELGLPRLTEKQKEQL